MMHHEGFSACPPRKILFFKQQSSHIVEEASSSQGVLGGIFAWSSHNLTQSHMNSHMMPSTLSHSKKSTPDSERKRMLNPI